MTAFSSKELFFHFTRYSYAVIIYIMINPEGEKAMADITAIGEILIDLTQNGVNESGIPKYNANPGGAPANLAVAASRLGARTAFIGRVGADAFGAYLRKVLEENGVDSSGLSVDKSEATTLAVVSIDEKGERSFSFYRDPSADVSLSEGDVPAWLVENTKILHFGSVSLTAEPSRSATLYAVKRAKASGAIISYDPNYRANLWPDEETAVNMMRSPLCLVDILKVSDNELPLLTGTSDPVEGTRILSELGIRLIFVTLGPAGAFYRFGDITGTSPTPTVKVADTNGAGDTFFGAALSRIAKLSDLTELTEDELKRIADFANRAASITTSRRGAIPAMPVLSEME